MILTLFPVCLKYLQLEGSMPASHNHLCLCGPFKLCHLACVRVLLFGWALTGFPQGLLGLREPFWDLEYFSLLSLW